MANGVDKVHFQLEKGQSSVTADALYKELQRSLDNTEMPIEDLVLRVEILKYEE